MLVPRPSVWLSCGALNPRFAGRSTGWPLESRVVWSQVYSVQGVRHCRSDRNTWSYDALPRSVRPLTPGTLKSRPTVPCT